MLRATGRNGRAQLGATACARSDPVTKVATVRQSELPLAPYTVQVTGEGIVFTLKKMYEFVFTNSTRPRNGSRIRRLLFSPPKSFQVLEVGNQESESTVIGPPETCNGIAPSAPVDDIETGKDRAAAYGYGLPAARSERGLASLFRVSAPNNYWVSSRTSVNFRKSRSNEATGMFSAAAVAAIRQSTKWTVVFP